MRSGNPVLKDSTFDIPTSGARMTLAGTVNKTAMLLALTIITSIYTWGQFVQTRDPSAVRARYRRLHISVVPSTSTT